jgi:ABC-type multidrug transport system ATPase subunit
LDSKVIIEVNNLFKNFGEIQAVNNLGFTVFSKDIFGFLGPNGSGKSTTIRMILSLVRPVSGQINIFGLPLEKNRMNILSRIGALVEEPRFYGYLSAYKNLEILGRLSGKTIGHPDIIRVLELTGLEKRGNSPVKTFSHGMKQRLGIAQAIIHDPELIILDEPGNGLDPKGMKEIKEIILRLNKESGKTIFISSHILNEVEVMANRMLIINKGAKVVEGGVAELLSSIPFKVELEVSEPDKAMKILCNNFSEIQPSIDTDGHIVMIVSKPVVPLMNQILVNNGIKIYSVHPVNTLENYFLDKT